MGIASFERLQLKQSNELKKRIISELAVSLGTLLNDPELGAWAEVVDGEEYVFDKIENHVSFGTLVFTFKPLKNPGVTIRLPLQLKLK